MAQVEPRHFLDLQLIDKTDLRGIIDRAAERKAARNDSTPGNLDPDVPLSGHVLALIFEKPSTRTRVSFDVGMRQLGGDVILLNSGDMQLGRGETIEDTAHVLERMVDAIMIRANNHQAVLDLAAAARVPVINGLTDKSHPCQIMADILTFEEHRGSIKDRVIAWSGDGNNVAASWIHAAALFDFELRLACPNGFAPEAALLSWAKAQNANVILTQDPKEAADGADALVTDTWVSMGDSDAETRLKALAPYQVNTGLMQIASKDAVFLHCLPAHRGEEVTPEVIDGPQSLVFDEAENRLHAQKEILVWCLSA